MLEIYDPCVEPVGPAAAAAARASVARPVGVLGILDNGKPNFDNLMTEVRAALADRVGEVDYRTKPSQSLPASPEWLAELARRCTLVLTGSGD